MWIRQENQTYDCNMEVVGDAYCDDTMVMDTPACSDCTCFDSAPWAGFDNSAVPCTGSTGLSVGFLGTDKQYTGNLSNDHGLSQSVLINGAENPGSVGAGFLDQFVDTGIFAD